MKTMFDWQLSLPDDGMGGSSLSSSSEGRGGSLSLLSSKISTLAPPLTVVIYFSYRTSLSVILDNFNQRSENPEFKSRIDLVP